MKYAILSAVAAALLAAFPASAAETPWDIDGAHSSVLFSVRHLMISNVRGTFDKVSGTVFYDGESYASVRVDAVIEAGSVNTREPDRDAHLRSGDFFDAAAHPAITFRSRQVNNIAGNRFQLVGDLTIRGTRREVVLDVEASGVITGMQGESRIGARATTRLNRQDFGVRWNRTLDAGGLVVGNEVDITLDLELTQRP